MSLEERKFSSTLDAYKFVNGEGFQLDVEENGDIYVCKPKNNMIKSTSYYIDTNFPRNRKIVREHMTIAVDDEKFNLIETNEVRYATSNFSVFYSHGAIFTASVFNTLFLGCDNEEPFVPKNRAEKILFEDIKNGKILN